MLMKSNRKSKPRVYLEGDFLIKDFGNQHSEAKKVFERLNAFRRSAGTTEINGYSVTAAGAEIAHDRPGCLIMPHFEGVAISELGEKDFEMAIRVVSAWFAQHLYKLQEYETGCVHGDLHTGNIIIDKKGRKIVLIDALCREARPENIWLDVLLFTVSISNRTGPTQTGNLQQMLYRDIIRDNPVLENRKLLLRQAMVLGRFFLFAARGVRERSRAFRSLMVGVKNFMRLLSPSTRK